MAAAQAHSHEHNHAHGADRGGNTERRLAAVLALTAAYMLAEVVGGLMSGSLALLADAGHMLSDVAALGLSLFAAWLVRRPATPRHTYGFYRAEILAALANGSTLVAVAVGILIEAWRRLSDPPEVVGGLMAAVAFGGLLVNMAGLWLLHGGRDENLNVRGAWLHLLTDALGSVGALTAAALIGLFGWNAADPIASALIALLVVWSAWSLLAQSVSVLMESAPAHVDVDEVREALAGLNGVTAVHDLHVWRIGTRRDALSGHLVADADQQPQALLADVRELLHTKFGITHITIQIEAEGFHGPDAAHCR